MDTPGITVSDRNTINLPIEIVDQILGYIRTDKECLRRCALVCKSWLPSCRRHIFYDLDFRGPPSRFEAWHRSVSPTPNGPHLNTKQLIVAVRSLDKKYYQSHNDLDPFFQHWFLFTNVRELYMSGVGGGERSLDNISPYVFGHLSDTLRSLRIQLVRCYPQTLISLITSFPHLERTDLSSVFFQTSMLPPPQLERHTFKGVFHFTDLGNSSEGFATLLVEHDLRYHEMYVRGERWLRETAWNRCLEKCAHHLEEFSIMWTERDETPTDYKFKMLAFKKLRKLSIIPIQSSTILPPVEFISSITSTQLSEITVEAIYLQPRRSDQAALDAIEGYEEALCRLSSRLASSFGGNKLVLTLKVDKSFPVPDAFLPRFREEGDLRIRRA